MDESYKIQLGVDIDVDDIQSQINIAENKVKPIKLNVEIENLNEIKQQLQNLGKNDKNTLTLNTTSLENSLKDVKGIIADIKTSIGTLDSKSGMNSLLSSINQISTALDKASDKFDKMNAELSALSKKDFSFNIGVKLGGSNSVGNTAAYGDYLRSTVIPELQRQEKALSQYLAKYYNTNELSAISNLLTKSGHNMNVGDIWELSDRLNSPIKKGELGLRAQELRNYINLIQQAASMANVDLSPVTSGFSGSANDMVQQADNIRDGVTKAKESVGEFEDVIKRAFGGGISSEQLDSIVVDLGKIKDSLEKLSNGDPLSGLTQSFDKLSASIDELIKKCSTVSTVLNDGIYGLNDPLNQSGSNVEGKTANDFNNSMESMQSSATETSGVITDLKNTLQSLNFDRSSIDAVTKDVEKLGFEVKDASVRMKNGKFDITVTGTDTVGRAITEVRRFNEKTKEIKGVSRTISQSFKEVDAFAKQQNRAVNDLTNQINQLNRAATDQNAARPIKDSAHLDSLESQYNEIIYAIQRMGAASNETFEAERNKVKTLIAEYKSLKSEYKNAENVAMQMDGNDFASGLEIAKNKLAEFKAQAQGFPQITQTIKELDNAIEGVGDVSSLKEFNNQLRVARSDLQRIKEETKGLDKIRFGLSDKGADSFKQVIASRQAAIDRLKTPADNLRNAMNQLNAAMDAMSTADEVGDIQKLKLAYQDYLTALKQVDSQLKLNQQTEDNLKKDASFEAAKQGALLRLKGLFSDNSQAAKIFSERLNQIQRELQECGDTKGLTKINRDIANLNRDIKNANVNTQTFAQRFKKQWQQYTSYFSVASVFMYASQGLRSMFEQVKLIDSAMTELKKVTNETDAAYSKFLSNAAKRSKEIGTTIDGLVSSTADFARLGYGFKDAQGLAEVANIYAVVGDEIEGVEGATESLISTMAAFKDEMNGMSNTDFAMSIIDKFNEIGNNFAISSGGIGEALERSASSLMAANNTIDESIALITAANTVVQDPVQVGKWLADYKSGYIG